MRLVGLAGVGNHAAIRRIAPVEADVLHARQLKLQGLHRSIVDLGRAAPLPILVDRADGGGVKRAAQMVVLYIYRGTVGHRPHQRQQRHEAEGQDNQRLSPLRAGRSKGYLGLLNPSSHLAPPTPALVHRMAQSGSAAATGKTE